MQPVSLQHPILFPFPATFRDISLEICIQRADTPQDADLAAMDLTQAQVGKLCTETNTFTIGEALGELEFEAEENEVTLNLNKAVLAEGEWGIFLPSAAAVRPNSISPRFPTVLCLWDFEREMLTC